MGERHANSANKINDRGVAFRSAVLSVLAAIVFCGLMLGLAATVILFIEKRVVDLSILSAATFILWPVLPYALFGFLGLAAGFIGCFFSAEKSDITRITVTLSALITVFISFFVYKSLLYVISHGKPIYFINAELTTFILIAVPYWASVFSGVPHAVSHGYTEGGYAVAEREAKRLARIPRRHHWED